MTYAELKEINPALYALAKRNQSAQLEEIAPPPDNVLRVVENRRNGGFNYDSSFEGGDFWGTVHDSESHPQQLLTMYSQNGHFRVCEALGLVLMMANQNTKEEWDFVIERSKVLSL